MLQTKWLVRDLVLERRECLAQALGELIRDYDFTDDWLEATLDAVETAEIGEQIDLVSSLLFPAWRLFSYDSKMMGMWKFAV